MFSCHTPYCYGDYPECKSQDEYEAKCEEADKECPHRPECDWEKVDTKTDRCRTCGKVFNYP